MISRGVPFELKRRDRGAGVDAGEGEEQRRTQAVRRRRDVSGAGAAVTLQSVRQQLEYQVRKRRSFTRFLLLGIEDRIPGGTSCVE